MVTPSRLLGDPQPGYVNQTGHMPTRKVSAATALGAVAAVLAWADDRFWGNTIPGHVEMALITLAVFAGGYFVRNRATDAPPAAGDRGAFDIGTALVVCVCLVLLVVLLTRI